MRMAILVGFHIGFIGHCPFSAVATARVASEGPPAGPGYKGPPSTNYFVDLFTRVVEFRVDLFVFGICVTEKIVFV